MRKVKVKTLFVLLILTAGCATNGHSEAALSDERIVVIGDIHGDYDNFLETLVQTDLVDDDGQWVAGSDVLVQLGDIPDRGPDSLRAVRYLRDLQLQAETAGGQVIALIGNHESMMMQGDLRYVHPGEYAAFVNDKSKDLRKRYYDATVQHIKSTTPRSDWPKFNRSYRKEWEQRVPLGYVELRQAWAPSGELGRWVLANSAVAQIDDMIFVHGGLSVRPPHMPISEINTRIRTELAAPDALSDDALVNQPDGPLWYRGLATLAETPENETAIDNMLSFYDAKKIVIGHTPILGSLLPRFDGRVILADVGLSSHYGGSKAALVIEDDDYWLYQNGERRPLPLGNADRSAYLASIKDFVPKPQLVERYLEKLDKAAVSETQAIPAEQR